MSQTAITFAFEQWKAKEAANGSRVVLDEFVFANVPGLDASKPIDRKEGMPAAGRIVHRQAVNKTGVVNNNAIVYSVTLGTEVGDFDFNWIGLVNKATNTVAMIVHAPTQRKVANNAGQQGNAITRSFVMEYDGAASETAITTPAETWQIDFTARLGGIDEMQRLINRDHYGAGAFFGNGFMVAKTGAQYFVTAGTGYVGGLRAVLAANQNITVATKPIKVWADVSLQGNVVSQWAAVVKLTVAATAADHTDNAGFKHYVFALASIDAAGNITDLRPKGSLSDQAGSDAYLRKDDNLASLKDKAKSRDNLGLGNAATCNVGEGKGQVMAVGAFGLGAAAHHYPDAVSHVAEIYRVTNSSSNAPGDGKANAFGVVSLPIDGQPRTGYIAVGNDSSFWIGNANSTNPLSWLRVYTSSFRPTAAEVGAWSKSEADGRYAQRANNLSDLPDKAKARENMGLKSAACTDIGEGAGHVLTGDAAYGLGVPGGARRHRLEDIAKGSTAFTGFTWSYADDPDNPPFAGAGGTVGIINHAWGTSTGIYALQIGWRNGKIGFRTRDSSKAFLAWGEFLHTGNAYTSAQTDGKYALRSLKINGKPLSGDVNLLAGDVNAWNKTEADGRYLMKIGGQLTGIVKTSAEIQSTKTDNYRLIGGDYGTFWRNDGSNLHLLMTKEKDQYGTLNTLRPFSVDVKTGYVTLGHNVAVNGLLRANKNISVGEDLFVDRHATVSGNLTVGKSTHRSDGNIMGSRWGNKWLWEAIIEQVSDRVDWSSFNNRTHVAGDRNAWWYKDELTGFIIQGGVVNRVDYVNWVGFPRGYARQCFGVQLTLTGSNGTWFGESQVNIQARDLDNNGFNAMMDGQEQVAFWQSVGV